jgi:hypothetical protein
MDSRGGTKDVKLGSVAVRANGNAVLVIRSTVGNSLFVGRLVCTISGEVMGRSVSERGTRVNDDPLRQPPRETNKIKRYMPYRLICFTNTFNVREDNSKNLF